MRQFDISNVHPEMMDVVQEFPEIFLVISDEILSDYENYGTDPDNIAMCNRKENLVNLRYGFECGLGWKEIIRGFCKDIRALCERAKANGHDVYYRSCIMKQKFHQFRAQGDFLGADRRLYYNDYAEILHKWEDESLKVKENE